VSDNLEAILHTMQKSIVAKKSKFNSFGKYHYRSCEDIIEAAKEVMPEGVSLVMRDEVVMIGERYYVQAIAAIISKDKTVQAVAMAREANEQKGMNDAQITGSASSYARKYALCGLFAIDDGIDDDSEKGKEPAKKTATPPKAPNPPKVETPEAVRDRLIAAINKQPTLEKLQEFCRIPSVNAARENLLVNFDSYADAVNEVVVAKIQSFAVRSPSGLSSVITPEEVAKFRSVEETDHLWNK